MISLICGIKKKKRYKWTYLQNRKRLTDLENEFMVTGGKGGGRGIVREFGIDNVHNAIFKINNQQGKKKKKENIVAYTIQFHFYEK